MTGTKHQFPPDFVWGSATSSYQIEGAVDADGRGRCIWDTFAAVPGKVKDGLDGRMACDHWERWPEDVALMKELGLQAYRFSIAWPRLFPTGLEPRALRAGLDTYDALVDGLLEAGIAPWVTLYHWDLPQALEDLGGWPDRRLVDHFVRFAAAVAERLGDRVEHWITHNEPWCIAHLGYGSGEHAPGRTSIPDSLAAAHHVLLSHGRAVPVLRDILPDTAKVGITLNLVPDYPASPSEADAREARIFDGFFNRWYLDPIVGRGYPADMLVHYANEGHLPEGRPPWLHDGDLKEMAPPIDFLGINYYSRAINRGPEEGNEPRVIAEPTDDIKTDIGWEVYPDGLYDLLTRLRRDYPGLPLAITENGAAYHTAPDEQGQVHDHRRVHYFREHLRACHRAIDAGVDLRAYFAWSLLDNFEWQEGYTQRFGITWVDYETQERIPKDSARWYARVIAGNAVVEG